METDCQRAAINWSQFAHWSQFAQMRATHLFAKEELAQTAGCILVIFLYTVKATLQSSYVILVSPTMLSLVHKKSLKRLLEFS